MGARPDGRRVRERARRARRLAVLAGALAVVAAGCLPVAPPPDDPTTSTTLPGGTCSEAPGAATSFTIVAPQGVFFSPVSPGCVEGHANGGLSGERGAPTEGTIAGPPESDTSVTVGSVWRLYDPTSCGPGPDRCRGAFITEFTVTPGLDLTVPSHPGLHVFVPPRPPTVTLMSVDVFTGEAALTVGTAGGVVNVVVTEGGRKLTEGPPLTPTPPFPYSGETFLDVSGLAPGPHTFTVVGWTVPPGQLGPASDPLTVGATIP